MHNNRAKVITGIRRCGKSYLIKNIFKDYLLRQGVREDHIIYLALDDIANNRFLNPMELDTYLRNLIIDEEMYYFLLDEIQRVYTIVDPIFTDGKIKLAKKEDVATIGFMNVVNGLIQIPNVDVYVTGSNSKFLSKDIMTEFRDRGDEIRMYPLSFMEIVESSKPTDLERAFSEYMMYGGMPLVQTFKTDEEKRGYLNRLFEMTYKRDIEERNNIKNPQDLSMLIQVMASNVSSLVNPTTIANTFNSKLKLKIDRTTVSRYLECLEDAFILTKVNRWDIKGRKIIGANYKYYFEDIGLRNSRLDYLHRDDGRVMENIIYNELVRRGYSVQVGYLETYAKNKENKTVRNILEADFVVSNGIQEWYIQSAYELHSLEKEEQESKSLLNIPNSFKKIIITRDSSPIRRDEKGIIYLGVKDFLLEEHILEII